MRDLEFSGSGFKAAISEAIRSANAMNLSESALVIYLQEALNGEGGFTARELARVLSVALKMKVDKVAVNRILYQRSDLFLQDGGLTPIWSLVDRPAPSAAVEASGAEDEYDFDWGDEDDWDDEVDESDEPAEIGTIGLPPFTSDDVGKSTTLRDRYLRARCPLCSRIVMGYRGDEEVVLFDDDACQIPHACPTAPQSPRSAQASPREAEIEAVLRARRLVDKSELKGPSPVHPSAPMRLESGEHICQQCGGLLNFGGRDRSCPHCAAG